MVEAIDSGVRILRLQQILSNYTVDDTFQLQEIDLKTHARLDRFSEVLEDTKKAVVWCRFIPDIHRVQVRLKEMGIPFVNYYGAIKDAERANSLDSFQEDSSIKVFLGQPACCGEGIDLSAADSIIWYSHTFDVIIRDQASERATEVGGQNVNVIDLAAPNSIDEYILKTLEDKRSVEEQVTGEALRQILKECQI
jgi:SNF2 family DNA or RNA helicase